MCEYKRREKNIAITFNLNLFIGGFSVVSPSRMPSIVSYTFIHFASSTVAFKLMLKHVHCTYICHIQPAAIIRCVQWLALCVCAWDCLNAY